MEQAEMDRLLLAYSKVFAGSTRAGTHADIVLQDLYDELLAIDAVVSAPDSAAACIAIGRQQAYHYIRNMIEQANANE